MRLELLEWRVQLGGALLPFLSVLRSKAEIVQDFLISPVWDIWRRLVIHNVTDWAL